MTSPRLLLDISTLLRHWDRADGITRTLSHFTSYALTHVPEVEFVYLGEAVPQRVNADHVSRLLAGEIKIDTSHFRDPGAKLRLRDRLPPAFKSGILWVQRPRRQALLWLERIAFREPRLGALAEWLRPRLLNAKYARALTAPNGNAIRLVPHGFAFGAMTPPAADDVLVLAGSDWVLMSNAVQRLDPKPRLVAFCYDIIPLLFPAFFNERNVSAFRDCLEKTFARADLVFFSASQIACDTAHYWQSRGLSAPPAQTIALGADIPTSAGGAGLPKPLVPQKFALFVSTIEPRKNHRLLFDVWKALLAEGIPQINDFSLVFVGRKGWMVDDFWTELTTHPSFGTSLFVLSDVDDAALDRLYRDCAFTLYPSFYEGFGLPIVESFRHGKAVIASSAGALPETVAEFSPCLSPVDETAWRDLLRLWIADPSARLSFERDITSRYCARAWGDAAGDFFRIIRQKFFFSAEPSLGASDLKQ